MVVFWSRWECICAGGAVVGMVVVVVGIMVEAENVVVGKLVAVETVAEVVILQ